MSVLSHQSILRLCTGANPVIQNHNLEAVKTASYDMHAGDFYYLSELSKRESVEIQAFDGRHSTVEIPPNQAIWVQMAEALNMPPDLVGHLTLKVDVLAKGLIMASQSQIDATYRGPIFALLYNLSDTSVSLKRGDRLLRLELAMLDEGTKKPYSGGFGPASTLKDVVPKRLSSGIVQIQNRLDRYRRFGVIGGVIALLATIATMVVSLLILQVQLVDPAKREAVEASTAVDSLRDDLLEMTERRDRTHHVAELRRRLRAVERRLARASRSNARN